MISSEMLHCYLSYCNRFSMISFRIIASHSHSRIEGYDHHQDLHSFPTRRSSDLSTLGIAMDDHAAAGDVEDPVVDDSGTGDQEGIGVDFDDVDGLYAVVYVIKVLRSWIFAREIREVTIMKDEIRFGKARGFVFRR